MEWCALAAGPRELLHRRPATMAARPPPAPPARALLLALAGALLAPGAARGKSKSPGGPLPAPPLLSRPPPGVVRWLWTHPRWHFAQPRGDAGWAGLPSKAHTGAYQLSPRARATGRGRTVPTSLLPPPPGANSRGKQAALGLGPGSRHRVAQTAQPWGCLPAASPRRPVPYLSGVICHGV